MSINFWIFFVALLVTILCFLLSEAKQQRAETRATAEEAGRPASSQDDRPGGKGRTTPHGVLDLADWPELLDQDKVESFFQECSEAFPQQREIYLPLAMSDRALRSTPPLKEELRLIETLRQVDRVQISTRALSQNKLQPYSFDVINFEV